MGLGVTLKRGEPLVIEHCGEKIELLVSEHKKSSVRVSIMAPQSFRVIRKKRMQEEQCTKEVQLDLGIVLNEVQSSRG